jgi:hypothetical protein
MDYDGYKVALNTRKDAADVGCKITSDHQYDMLRVVLEDPGKFPLIKGLEEGCTLGRFKSVEECQAFLQGVGWSAQTLRVSQNAGRAPRP